MIGFPTVCTGLFVLACSVDTIEVERGMTPQSEHDAKFSVVPRNGEDNRTPNGEGVTTFHLERTMTTLVISDFTVTRQIPYHTGNNVVEISQGGIDYTGSDALCKKYDGEFETFQGMTPAVEKAIEIAEAWKKDTKDPIYISHGCSHGMGLSFDEERATKKTYKALREFAKEFDAKLPHCDQCGELLGEERYGSHDAGEYNCCSEYCAEKYWAPGCIHCGDTIETSYGDHDDCCSQKCADAEYPEDEDTEDADS